MSDNVQKLGSLIYSDILPERDAVHIAIIPGTSKQTLNRADWVVYNPQTAKFDKSDAYAADGIVDPFINNSHVINAGTAFYVCLKPGSIMSLRHAWVHKTIPPENINNLDKKSFSRSWLEGFADTADMSYDELIWAARDYLKSGNYVCEGGRYEGFQFPIAFWDHYETVTGESVPENKRWSFFTCSC